MPIFMNRVQRVTTACILQGGDRYVSHVGSGACRVGSRPCFAWHWATTATFVLRCHLAPCVLALFACIRPFASFVRSSSLAPLRALLSGPAALERLSDGRVSCLTCLPSGRHWRNWVHVAPGVRGTRR